MIVVERAPPYLTVQDVGRPGYRASGVPHSGAMDQWSLALANLLVANQRSAAALEWAIGAGALRFERDAVIALTGAEVEGAIDNAPIRTHCAISVHAGQVLTIHRLVARRFLYVGVHGGVDCPPILGSRSTYLPAAFGGIDGRRLIAGDRLEVGTLAGNSEGTSETSVGVVAPDYDSRVVRAIARSGGSEFLMSFLDTTFTVSAASDRTGYRLEGDHVLEADAASITSEPVCAGAIQLTPSGQPIVLMADSPTIGGYCILGTVITCDLPIVAQSMPGRKLRFVSVAVGAAQDELRRRERFLSGERQRRP
jgi:biotin-dependent carboxylase-like uncharacterized protein